jgi:hypothetical protein
MCIPKRQRDDSAETSPNGRERMGVVQESWVSVIQHLSHGDGKPRRTSPHPGDRSFPGLLYA